VLKSLLWLRRENLNRGHIYVRPSGVHGLSLVDDLKAAAIAEMKAQGFEPALVVETSPGNFQALLKHGQVLDEVTSTWVAKELALRFGGDPSSADWRHFGRLAGFTNPKRERQLPSGLRPFARLRSATGRVYSRAAEFLADIRSNDERRAAHEQETRPRPQRRRERAGVKPLKEFHSDSIYAGDLHRADMAWSKHAAGCGLTLEQIRNELFNGRDLSKKGNRKRQLEYAERTARKAIEQM